MNQREYWAIWLEFSYTLQRCRGHTGVGRWYITSRIEENWHIDVADPAVGVAAIQQIYNASNNRLDSQ